MANIMGARTKTVISTVNANEVALCPMRERTGIANRSDGEVVQIVTMRTPSVFDLVKLAEDRAPSARNR